MIAYTLYMSDARIKSYVKTIEKQSKKVDILVLKENGKVGMEKMGENRIFYLTKKYQGENLILYILSYFSFFIRSFLKLNMLFLNEHYTSIHVHNMPNFIIFTTLIPRLLGVKVILDVHDLMTVVYKVKFGISEGSLLNKILLLEQKISTMFASHIICADHMQNDYLIKVSKIPKNKITVSMNLPHKEIFKPVISTKKDEDQFKLVYHGTIVERVGIDILLQSVAQIKDKIPLHLSIYGGGDFLKEALSMRRKLELEKVVHFSKCFFPVEKIPEILSSMDVGIVPYKKNLQTDRFGMSVKLMEYVYLQIPVIAPRLHIIKLYFDENMIKFYEPENIEDLAKCIVELYENPEERKSLVKNANKFFEKYNRKNQEGEYLKLISSNK